jgi:hypothetical protein
MSSISDKYDIVEQMYRLGASDPRSSVLLQEVRAHLGWPDERFAPVVVELNNDDKWIDVQTIPRVTGYAALTLDGRREVERRLRPISTITHNTINAKQIIGSPIQQASPHATQSAHLTFNVETAREALKAFETAIQNARLPAETLAELTPDIETIRAQLAKPSPSKLIIQEAGRSIRNVCEGIAGGMLTPAVVSAATTLWSILGLG